MKLGTLIEGKYGGSTVRGYIVSSDRSGYNINFLAPVQLTYNDGRPHRIEDKGVYLYADQFIGVVAEGPNFEADVDVVGWYPNHYLTDVGIAKIVAHHTKG